MARDEVDTLLGFTFFMPINIRATDQSLRKALNVILFAAQETSNIVSKYTVPFLPVIANEAADLVKTCCIPGFGNQFRTSQNRIGFDVPQDWWIRQRSAIGIASKD